MNWKNLVEESHAKTYKLPQGWDSRDTIADQLGCSNENVRRLLAPAIKAGTIETGAFSVWDDLTKKLVRVTAYRRVPPAAKKK